GGSARADIYVVPFPGPGDRVRVSPQGGTSVRWRRDGKELYYAVLGTMFVASVNGAGSRFEVLETEQLMTMPRFGPISFDVSADGQKVLMRTSVEEDTPPPMTVVINWTAGLKK